MSGQVGEWVEEGQMVDERFYWGEGGGEQEGVAHSSF